MSTVRSTSTVTVRHPDSSAPSSATLEVILQGVTDTADAVGHQVRVRVNGTVVGDVTFVGRDQGVATLTVPHGLLLEGTNTVQLEALGGAADLSMFDTLRLTYWHTNEADDDKLLLTADAQQTVTILGFASSPVRVVDITDPEAVLELPATAGRCRPPSSCRRPEPAHARSSRSPRRRSRRRSSWSPTSRPR